MTLDQHLAKAYDYFQHGLRKNWNPGIFAKEMQDSPELLAEAKAKRTEIEKMIRVRSGDACHVSKFQLRAIIEAMEKIGD